MLEAVPVRTCGHVIHEQGLVAVVVPKFRRKWLVRWLLNNRPKTFQVRFDRMGSATWLAIDGKRNVAAICSEVRGEAGQDTGEIEERVAKFLSLLYEQRYISFLEIEDGR
jgi:hypothetical protein